MDSTLNEGYANDIAVQAEATFLGSPTGTARRLPGRINFAYQPQLAGGLAAVNIWRMPDGDSYSSRWYEGSFDLEYNHGETVALLLASLLQRSGSSPSYEFSPHSRSSRTSLIIGLSYLPNGQHLMFRGAIIESARFIIRARELLRVTFGFKAARLTSDGPLASVVDETILQAGGHQADLTYDSTAIPRAYDASFQFLHRIGFTNFDESATPADYEPHGVLGISADLAEWMSNVNADGDLIAGNVRDQSEAPVVISVVPGAGKEFTLSIPRSLTRSGTPPGLQARGIGYRAGIEAQIAGSLSGVPLLTMTL